MKNQSFLLLISIFVIKNLSAATFCVTTTNELQSALTAAASNNQHDTIKVQVGQYNAPTGGFLYSGFDENFDLILSGGWTPFFNNGCVLQISPDPSHTVLDGNDTNRIMRIYLDDNHTGDVAIEYLSFLNGNSLANNLNQTYGVNENSAAILFNEPNNHEGNLIIQNNIFGFNKAARAAAFKVNYAKVTKILNNVFHYNHTTDFYTLETYNGADSEGLYFVNNTIIYNTTDATNQHTGLLTITIDPSITVINNNIMWGNQGSDLRIGSASNPGDVYLFNNNIEDWLGSATYGGNNLSFYPEFEGMFGGDYHLKMSSPLINKGLLPPEFPIPGFQHNWNLTTYDIDGNSRVQGNFVDIGAHETSDVLFADDFE